MKILVSGKNINIGASLKEYVDAELLERVSKYFDKAIEADVVLTKEGHLFKTDILVNEGTGTGVVIKGDGKADDVYASFDQAADRIAKQLRRYKRRLKDHKNITHEERAIIDAAAVSRKYVLSEDGQEGSEDEKQLIVAEKPTKIETLSVSDAVMRMNLGNLPALMFVNHKSGKYNVVYHRKDGNISWVEAA